MLIIETAPYPLAGPAFVSAAGSRALGAGRLLPHISHLPRDLMSDNDPDVARGLVKALRLRLRKDSLKPDSKPPSAY